MANVGDKAPSFTLKASDGGEVREISLSDFTGKKVLLAFYPFAFSPTCHDELCEFRDGLATLQTKGVEVLAISVDSHWTAKAFAESLQAKYLIVSDFDKKTADAYGVLRPEGFAERAYFVIDGEGSIIAKHVMDTPGAKLGYSELLELVG